MYRVIGQCSRCGGQVTVPVVWHGIFPPIPSCVSCGGEARSELPVIQINEPVKAKQSKT